MAPVRVALLGLAGLYAGAAMRLESEEESHSIPAPVVIVGLGKKPTSLVKHVLTNLGVSMCSYTKSDDDIDGASNMSRREDYFMKKTTSYIPDLLKASEGEASKAFGYHESPSFWTAVREELKSSKQSRECVKYEQKDVTKMTKNNHIWGYQSLDHIHMLPVVDEAFRRKERIVAVVRDPRGSCSGTNKEEFGKWQDLVNNPHESSDYSLTGDDACLHYWAKVWKSLLAEYGQEDRFRVVRIEDLTDPKPSADNPTLSCLLQHVGVSPSTEERREHLLPLHDRMATFSGVKVHSNATSAAVAMASSEDSLLRGVMRQLGYSPGNYGPVEPQSRAVCGR
uniref:Protein-tyrosine sulfotransferase n=1 Tax=Alexandrium catenella TaxID=2925 RepID=A0A7S1WN16_ALECA